MPEEMAPWGRRNWWVNSQHSTRSMPNQNWDWDCAEESSVGICHMRTSPSIGDTPTQSDPKSLRIIRLNIPRPINKTIVNIRTMVKPLSVLIVSHVQSYLRPFWYWPIGSSSKTPRLHLCNGVSLSPKVFRIWH